MERLLVVRGGALGDFVLGLPALQALRQAFPHAHLELIAPAAVLSLASPWVDVAIPLERAEMATLFQEGEGPPEALAGRYSSLDLVVLWLADGSGAVRHNFERLGARRLLWAPALPQRPGRHAVDHLLDTLRPLGIAAEAPSCPPSAPNFDTVGARGLSPLRPWIPIVMPGELAREKARNLRLQLGIAPELPAIAIHPGSGGVWKCWPPGRFAQVADHLLASGRQVVLIQGPADEAVAERVLATVREGRPPVVAGPNPEELSAFLASCSGYLGNDSGVTHLAAAVGTPTVAIFGPTDPAIWGPRGRRVQVLQASLGCAPCSRERAIACPARVCLESITVEQVASAMELDCL